MNKKLSHEQVTELLRQYVEEGSSSPQLAIQFGITKTHVCRLLKQHGVATRPAGKLTPNERQIIAHCYRKGQQNSYQLAAEYNVDPAAVQYWLRKLGVQARLFRKIPPVRHPELVQRYSDGDPPVELAREFSVSLKTICLILRQNGVVLDHSKHHRQYEVNIHAFDDLNNLATQYFLGLLFADGCVIERKERKSPVYSVRLSLAHPDRALVEAFRSFLQSSHPIYVCRNRSKKLITLWDGTIRSIENVLPQSCIAIGSKALAEKLISYGMIPRKSLTAKAPNAVLNCPDFWRGVIDGDGWVCFGRGTPILGLCGSRPMMEQFSAFVRSIYPNCKATVAFVKTCWAVSVSGNAAVAMIKALRYDQDVVALPRKKATAIECLKWVPRNRPRCL